jgi:hypothetical protein
MLLVRGDRESSSGRQLGSQLGKAGGKLEGEEQVWEGGRLGEELHHARIDFAFDASQNSDGRADFSHTQFAQNSIFKISI